MFKALVVCLLAGLATANRVIRPERKLKNENPNTLQLLDLQFNITLKNHSPNEHLQYQIRFLNGPANNADNSDLPVKAEGKASWDGKKYAESSIVMYEKPNKESNNVYMMLKLLNAPESVKDQYLIDISNVVKDNSKTSHVRIADDRIILEANVEPSKPIVLPEFGIVDCQCVAKDCSCCMNAAIAKLKLASICAKLQYSPQTLGINIDLTLNGKSAFHGSVSGVNPPPLCIPIPEVKLANICLQFYNMAADGQKLNGCIKVQGKVAMFSIFKATLGCFHLG